MEVKINLNNKSYTGFLGLGFIGEVIDILDISYDELLSKYDKNPFKYVPLLMFHSIEFNHFLKNEEIDFTKNDMFGWIDKEGGLRNKAMLEFSTAFLKFLAKDVPKEEVKEATKEESKKK